MDGDQNGTQNNNLGQSQPGQTIAPSAAQPVPPAPAVSPLPAPVPPQPQPVVITPQPVAPLLPQTEDGLISWTASEFVSHHKSAGWYGLLGGGSLVAAIIIWLFTRDTISAVSVVVAAAIFGFYGARQPRELQYILSEQGLRVGSRYFSFDQFRSFSIVPEGAFDSIVFVPLQRFAPLTTIYYDPADEDKIVDLLADRLPHEERERDMFERMLWRIRF